MTTAPFGLALCCGASPVSTRDERGWPCLKCETCGHTQKQAIGGSADWIAGAWNESLHKTRWNVHGEHWSQRTLVYEDPPELDLPGWLFGRLEYTYHPPYGSKEVARFEFCLFETPGRGRDTLLKSKCGFECYIDEYRCVNPLRLRALGGGETLIEIPQFKRARPVQMFISRGWSTDNTWWYIVNIVTHNWKWHQIIGEKLSSPEMCALRLGLAVN